MPVQRLVIPDPSLMSLFGHHFNYDQAVIEAARRRGLPTVLISHRDTIPQVQDALAAVPIFNVSSYTSLPLEDDRPGEPLDPWFKWGRQLLQVNDIFRNDLNKLSQFFGPDDLLFFHTLSDIQVLGAVQWLLSFPDDRRPSSNFVFRFWHDRPHSDAVLQLAAANLSAPKMRSRISTDTTELAALYSHMLRVPVDLIPIPHPAPQLAADRRRFLPELAPGTVVIGYAGDCRWGKGFHFLRALIETFRNTPPPRPVHFLIQVSTHASTPEIDAEVAHLASYPAELVTLVTETLSTADYHGLMHEMDIVLITYFAKHFAYQSSGVFTEAATAGKVTIVPEGTAMHHEALRMGAGFRTFDGFEAIPVVQSVWSAVADYPALAERAVAAGERMARYHNGDNLLAYLLGEEVVA